LQIYILILKIMKKLLKVGNKKKTVRIIPIPIELLIINLMILSVTVIMIQILKILKLIPLITIRIIPVMILLLINQNKRIDIR